MFIFFKEMFLLNILIILFINNLNGEYINDKIYTCGSYSIPYLLTVDLSGHPG